MFVLSFILSRHVALLFSFFFFNDTATTEIYTLSLHDALPISWRCRPGAPISCWPAAAGRIWSRWQRNARHRASADRKSTRLNSSHVRISYAVFCLKKKKPITTDDGYAVIEAFV